MADPVVPSFVVNKDNQIHLSIPQTDATLVDQGYTYNQANFTYNQAGVEYGGVQLVDTDVLPMILTTQQDIPHMSIAPVSDQYTPGVTGACMGCGWFMYVLHAIV